MSGGFQKAFTTQFVLVAVKHEASYWTPATIIAALAEKELLVEPSEEELVEFRDGILKALVGKQAERFWASDALTPAKAAAIRAACKALHEVTLDTYSEQ